MKQWRVSKYNPAFRDSSGAYLREEWTSYGDIGQCFGGIALTHEEYLQVEDRYVESVLRFAKEAKVSELVAVAVENGTAESDIVEGQVIPLMLVEKVVRRILRGDFWCKLESPGSLFVHFGYDYYMYIGSTHGLPASVSHAIDLGLFVEECDSPYLENLGTS